jgi:hypothetical protein
MGIQLSLNLQVEKVNRYLWINLNLDSIFDGTVIDVHSPCRCGETAKLEDREPNVDTPPHLTWYPKRNM